MGDKGAIMKTICENIEPPTASVDSNLPFSKRSNNSAIKKYHCLLSGNAYARSNVSLIAQKKFLE